MALEGSDLEGITHCRFGSQVVVPIDAASDNGIICSSPHSHTVEDVLVQVTHNGQDFASSDVMFSYRATPSLLDLMPSFGGANTGGKTVYISGSDFSSSPNLSCRFGESTTKAMFISDTLISCKTVPMELGRVSLEVSLNGVDFVGGGLFYETINLPQMSNMHLRIGTLNEVLQ